MQSGAFLEDVGRAERRFRVKELLFDAGEYQIALAEDVWMDDKLVCVKTIAYDDARTSDKKYVGMRRKALHEELTFLSLPVHLLPEPLDWIQVAESRTALPREPLLVYEYVHGETLYELVTTRYPEGIAPSRALRITRELCRFLAQIHERKWVFRNLDPRHVIVGYDDVIHLVGCGNATPLGQQPNPTRATLESPYVAPEVRGEISGKFLRPAADLYSLGALLSFVVTGCEPRSSVENPLAATAHDRLTRLEPAGIALLVARCMQPLAKKRFGRAGAMLPYTTMQSLPNASDDGFGLLELPRPFTGAEPPESRASRSKLSPGPLISVEKKGEPEQTALQKKEKRRPDWTAVAAVAFFLFAILCGVLTLVVP